MLLPVMDMLSAVLCRSVFVLGGGGGGVYQPVVGGGPYVFSVSLGDHPCVGILR